jgi:hypothetical protein
VVRFCKAQLDTNEGDAFAILGCLQRKRARISAPSREVLADDAKLGLLDLVNPTTALAGTIGRSVRCVPIIAVRN